MDTTSIGNLFGNIPGEVLAAANALNAKVEAAPFNKDVSLDTGSKSLQLFGTPVTVDAVLKAAVATGVPERQPFGDGSIVAIAGTTYTGLTIDGALSASTSPSATQGVLQLSASATANARFSYAHYRPAANGTPLLKAFQDLATTTTLPQLANLKSLTPGEVLDFTGSFGVDLGLKATYGKILEIHDTFELFSNLTNDLSLPFSAQVSLAVSAAFGFSLADSMHYTVGRAGQTQDPTWIRIRLDRENKNSISFGLAINLSIDYDATSGAQMLLDKAFALVPTPKVLKTLESISDIATNDWSAFKQKVSDEAAVVIGRLVDNIFWKDVVEGNPAIQNAIQKLVDGAKKIVDLYKKLDDKVKSVFEQVIAKLDAAGLAKLKPVIHQIAAIDPATVDLNSLLSQQEQNIVHWIEVLSGRSLEDLVLTGSVKTALTRAVALAKQIDDFFSGAGADAAIAEVNDILKKSGAAGLVEWLQKNAQSVADLKKAGDQAVSDIVHRLVGKAFDQLSDDDIKKIQDFAKKLNDIITAPQKLHDKLQKGIQKLKGTLGFNVSVEINRVSEHSSIVDVEIDPASAAAVAAVRSNLTTGDIHNFLTDLNNIKANDDGKFPYVIREVILTSRQVRTSVSTTVASFLKFSITDQEQRITESTILVHGGGSVPATREAIYSGGGVTRRVVGSSTFESSAFIRFDATGDGSVLTADYKTVASTLRLSYAREDKATDPSALSSLRQILLELGVGTAGPGLTAQTQTRFALEIEFDDKAIRALVTEKDVAKWNRDALNASHVWFADVDQINGKDRADGTLMSQATVNKRFGELWDDFVGVPSGTFVTADVNGEFGTRLTEKGKFKPRFIPLAVLIMQRGTAFKGYNGFKADLTTKSPKEIGKAIDQAASLFANGENAWRPPLFNFWLVLARLVRLGQADDVLANAHGLATLRSRATDNDDWGPATPFQINGVSAAVLKTMLPLS